MSWEQHRRGRHVSIAVPPEIKCQLIRNKALGGGGIGAQIVEACYIIKWGTVPMTPPAVIENRIRFGTGSSLGDLRGCDFNL